MQANLGYLFYHGIYEIISSNSGGKDIKSDVNRIKSFLETKIENTTVTIGNHHFSLYTTYPGLMTGVGMAHGVKDDDKDFKIGFYFDHTTGLPHIPGSSVKGVLRSVFPCLDKNPASQLVKFKWLHALIKGCKEEADFLQKDYEPFEAITSDQLEEIEKIEKEIFDGIVNDAHISIYKRDIFHDAVINTTQTKFLGTDYITPHHPNLLKNPTPIQFLKILPNIEFEFRFQLNGGILSANQKKLLFQKILLTLGIGAKTNVGYGQFSKEPLAANSDNQNNDNNEDQNKSPIPPKTDDKPEMKNKIKNYSDYKASSEVTAEVIEITDEWVTFGINNDILYKRKDAILKKWDEDSEKRKKKNKSGEYKALEVLKSVTIRINKDFSLVEQNFTVMPQWV